mgnify:CR=1 FL=1
MMQRFEKQEFYNRYDPDTILSFHDLEFFKCKFLGGGFGYRYTDDFSRRTSAKNIRVIDCESQKFGIGPALLEDIYVENFRGDLVTVWGALFKHVTIKGRCDKLMIHGAAKPGMLHGDLARYWDICNVFYTDVDWALDIREAEFNDFCIRTGGVPANLVRRDPETQVMIKRNKAIEGKWRELGLSGLTQMFFKDLIEEAPPAAVLVAPKRHKKDFKDVLEDIRRLRDVGIAEPE